MSRSPFRRIKIPERFKKLHRKTHEAIRKIQIERREAIERELERLLARGYLLSDLSLRTEFKGTKIITTIIHDPTNRVLTTNN